MEAPSAARHPEFVIVLLGGLGLAACAGYINTLLILLGAPPVTHMTGSISRMSADLGRGELEDARFIAMLVLAFLSGAALSGVMIGSSHLRLGRRYGLTVLVEAALLVAAALALPRSLPAGAMLAASAAGLQNAMASSYRALIIRTTHVTGVLTDIGFMFGQLLAGHQIGGWRFLLLGMVLVAFLLGGVSGAVASAMLGESALWVPAVGLALGGGTYFIWRRFFMGAGSERDA